MGRFRAALVAGLAVAGMHVVAAAPLILVTAHFPPYTMEEGGGARGVAVDLVKEVFSRTHQEVRILVAPLPRAIEMIKSGQSDGIFPFALQEERKLFARYPSEKLFSDPGALFVRADSRIKFDGDYSKLAGHTFGMQRGTFQGPAFAAAAERYEFKIEPAIDQEQNVRKLTLGRFDIAVGPRLLIQDSARRANQLAGIRLLYTGISEGDAYIALSVAATVKNPRLLGQLDQALREMRKDGTHQRIFSSGQGPHR